jgi:hypothetical protein
MIVSDGHPLLPLLPAHRMIVLQVVAGDEIIPSPLESCSLVRCSWTQEDSAAKFVAGLQKGKLSSFVLDGPVGVSSRLRSKKVQASAYQLCPEIMQFASTLSKVHISMGLEAPTVTADVVFGLLTRLPKLTHFTFRLDQQHTDTFVFKVLELLQLRSVDSFPNLLELGLPSGAYTDGAITAFLNRCPALTRLNLAENCMLKFGDQTFAVENSHVR